MCKEDEGRLRIGDALVKKGYLTDQDLRTALQKQKRSGLRLGEQLLEMKLVTEEALLECLCDQLGVPMLHMAGVEISPSAYHSLNEEYITEKGLVPIDFVQGELVVAHPDPQNLKIIEDEVSHKTGIKARVYAATPNDIMKTKARFKQRMRTFEPVLEQLKNEDPDREIVQIEKAVNLDDDSSSMVTFLNLVLTTGVQRKATDIYIRAVQERLEIRYRVDGVALELLKWPSELNQHKEKLVSRLKTIANMDIAEKRLPQDGKFRVKLGTNYYDCRLSVVPSIFGENAVIRILYKEMLKVTLDNTGLSNYSFRLVTELLKKPHGLMLVTGPTGSGKTTTLYACMASIFDPSKVVTTVEDPVEYEVEDYIQFQVRHDIGLNFATMLRSILRQTPDVILVGEIRDTETAQMACEAAMTGHFVFSTLHTNNATSSVLRLTEMKVDRFLVSAVLVGVIAQRLVRHLCSKCRLHVSLDQELKEFAARYKLQQDYAFEASGCDSCFGTGYIGRLGLHEVLVRTGEIAEIINHGGSSGDIYLEARKSSFVTMREDGFLKVLKGLTDKIQVDRVTA
ncbi:Flp pilus assembly complex ATPase component TadA [bacterium]|jgi:type IV pilus assembly protein PilB|nr:Flp pilus assembly complex ATPase component TadA [bacterium]